jgi:ubiquinone/menaquinone biosynthesis C-methylase UbiE
MTGYAAKTGYQDREIAETYESRRFSTFRGRLVHSLELRAVQRAVARAAPIDRLLDLPCGTARLMHPLGTSGLSMWGADISLEMLLQAKSRLIDIRRKNGANPLVLCDAEALPFADEAFDCVVSLRFMGHLPPNTRKHILREMGRITRRWLAVAFYISDPIFRVKRALRRAMSRPYSAFPTTWRELDQDLSSVGLRRVGIFPVARFHLSETHILLLSVK